MKPATRLIGLCLVFALAATSTLQGQTLFSDNFDSYQAGTEFNGQGGWLGSLKVGSSAALGSLVMDGRQEVINDSGVGVAAHSLSRPLSASEITRFTFDAFATSTGPMISTNSGAYLASGPFGTVGAIGWTANGSGWAFGNQNAGLVNVPGGYDLPVAFGVVVDGPAHGVYGFYDFGAGQQTTAHFAITTQQIVAITSVSGITKFFGTLGAQFDNFNVVVVPEPSVGTLLLVGWFASRLLRKSRIHN